MAKKKQPKGLGDTIKRVTDATGITSIVHLLFGTDCGCDERQAKLNKLFPYTNYMTQTEFEYMDDFFTRNPATITMYEQRRLVTIFNRVFDQRRQISSCPGCYRAIIEQLKQIYDAYLKDVKSDN